MKRLAIYCADIGSIRRGNFGWAVLDGDHQHHGEAIGGLVDDVVANLAAGTKVALGFECPLWVPVSGEPSDLAAGRAVDGNRSWSAAAGTCALAAGLTETAWILKQMRLRLTERSGSIPRAYLGLGRVPSVRVRSVPLGGVRGREGEGSGRGQGPRR